MEPRIEHTLRVIGVQRRRLPRCIQWLLGADSFATLARTSERRAHRLLLDSFVEIIEASDRPPVFSEHRAFQEAALGSMKCSLEEYLSDESQVTQRLEVASLLFGASSTWTLYDLVVRTGSGRAEIDSQALLLFPATLIRTTLSLDEIQPERSIALDPLPEIRADELDSRIAYACVVELLDTSRTAAAAVPSSSEAPPDLVEVDEFDFARDAACLLPSRRVFEPQLRAALEAALSVVWGIAVNSATTVLVDRGPASTNRLSLGSLLSLSLRYALIASASSDDARWQAFIARSLEGLHAASGSMREVDSKLESVNSFIQAQLSRTR